MTVATKIKDAGRFVAGKVSAATTGISGMPLVKSPFGFPTGRKRRLGTNQVRGIQAPGFTGIDSRFPWDWANVASRIGVNGYLRMRASDAVAPAAEMLGDELGKLKLFAFAPQVGIDINSPEARLPENQSERAKAFQAVYDQMLGITQFQQKSPWSLIEGVLFWQIRWVFVEGVGLVPDLRWGERRKVEAGGHLFLHPDHETIVVERYTAGPAGEQPEEVLSNKDWIILKPGTSANPQGDGELALAQNRTAALYEEGDYNGAVFAKSMTLPTRILKWVTDQINRQDQARQQEDIADAVDWQDAMEVLVLSDKQTVVDLLKYPTDGADYLLQRETRLESRAMKRFMNTALLADTRATGPTGSSKEARTTANSPVINFANFLAESVTCYVNPMIDERNAGMLGIPIPERKEGELEVRAQYVFPGELPSDTNPTRESAADVVPEEKRPDPEGTGTKDKDSDEV